LRPSNLLRLGVIGTVLYFVFSLGAGIFLAEHAIRPEREPINPINSEPLWNFARGIRATMSDAEIERPGNVTLRGWGIRPANANSGSVLLLHGLSENRTAMSGVAEFLLAAGYSVLMPDARAHGESGGDVATYGLLEAGDIRAWVDWILNNQHPECVFALGESMGAAELLESLAEETRFCAVAAESAFANFREAAYDHVSQPFYAQPWLGRSVFRPIVEFGLLYSRVRYGLDLTGLSPEEIVAKTKTPILLIHGTDDSVIPLRHSLRIAAANPSVEVWEVINAGHCEAFRMWRADFERRLLSWFSSHAADTGSARKGCLDDFPAIGQAPRLGVDSVVACTSRRQKTKTGSNILQRYHERHGFAGAFAEAEGEIEFAGFVRNRMDDDAANADGLRRLRDAHRRIPE
jgi:hypothetical protein